MSWRTIRRKSVATLASAMGVVLTGSTLYAQAPGSVPAPLPPGVPPANSTLVQPALPSAIPAPAAQVFQSAPCENCGGVAQTYTLLETIRGSILDRRDPSEFTPLGLYNFGEGWLQPWIPAGPGSSGALRGGWVGAPNGFFSREFDPFYTYVHGAHGTPNENLGSAIIFTPLSRRLEFSIVVPYANSINSDPHESAFGDLQLRARVMLYETQDVSFAGGIMVEAPTGTAAIGQGQTAVDPFLALWADLGNAIQVRAGIDDFAPTDGSGPNVLTCSLAFGKTFKIKECGYFQDVTPYLASNVHEAFSHAGDTDHTVFSLTPGVRTTVAHNVWIISGLEVPVTGDRPFNYAWTTVLSLGW